MVNAMDHLRYITVSYFFQWYLHQKSIRGVTTSQFVLRFPVLYQQYLIY